jgi:hypothetical protein
VEYSKPGARIPRRPGSDAYQRGSKLLQTQENLKNAKLFNGDKGGLNIMPLEDLSKINIEFAVE